MQLEWSQPQILGDLVANPRAGHAGAVVDENWYIVGGGDNRNGMCKTLSLLIMLVSLIPDGYLFTGCPETLVLDMSKLVWSVLTSVKPRDPLASEVITLPFFLYCTFQW